jgi:hypothetical protein
MPGGIGNGQVRFAGQTFNRSGSLAQEVQDLQPLRAGDGLADAGKLFVDAIFKESVGVLHFFPFLLFNELIE